MQRSEDDKSRLEWQRRHTQALRDTAESLQMGRATAHALSAQAEQLGRSERVLDETQATVDMSKRVLRGMTWSGWLYNKFSASPQLSTNREGAEIAMGFICPECKVMFQSPEQLGMHYSSVHERRSGDGGGGPRNLERQSVAQIRQQKHQQVAVAGSSSIEDVHDKFLSDLEPQLAELKEQSLALGSALDSQNEQLDRLDSKIGRVHHDMKKVGIQANKIAGKKVPVVYRFRCAFQEVQTGRFLRDVDGEALLSADVVIEGCTFRAYTLGDDSDVWGFQSEKSSNFLGINRYGNLKVRGVDFNSYEQFLVEAKPSTPLFCLSSYFGLGGWVAVKGPTDSSNLTIIRGTPENKPQAAHFKIVNLEDGIKAELKDN
ncbi:conserved c2h2 zinc finger protein [Phytophthora cinnamomi]|uniref:conserved c2h2 zinc finger protein n=1 Tax=Phytophthora cinnamomi TaxID=4785 RepID=UPI003559397F|nr:conserved c2h2 zinc finger protein [Phytophthora cinnamomi]